jgi:hypothetical protein
MSKDAMKLALEAFIAAGFGNSTDFALQSKALDLAVEALAKQDQGEPVAEVATTNERQAIITWRGTPLPHGSVLYSTPQQHTWLGLTLDDKKEYLSQDFGGSRADAMDWTEQRLKDKNSIKVEV